MTLQEKAKQYFEYKQNGDLRCFMLVSLMSQMFNISVEEVERRIMELSNDSPH